MRRTGVLLMAMPALCNAGAHDYYECVAADGTATYSVERCAKGERQRRIADDAAPTSRNLGAGGGGTVRLESRGGGHFFATASINGVPVRAMVDTGATTVAISPAAAQRVGVDLKRGKSATYWTANGQSAMTTVVLDVVDLGGNRVRMVPGNVTTQELGPDFDVLLGMSFLKHFEVNTDGVVMTLRPK